jgi:hypothetical protein
LHETQGFILNGTAKKSSHKTTLFAPLIALIGFLSIGTIEVITRQLQKTFWAGLEMKFISQYQNISILGKNNYSVAIFLLLKTEETKNT